MGEAVKVTWDWTVVLSRTLKLRSIEWANWAFYAAEHHDFAYLWLSEVSSYWADAWRILFHAHLQTWGRLRSLWMGHSRDRWRIKMMSASRMVIPHLLHSRICLSGHRCGRLIQVAMKIVGFFLFTAKMYIQRTSGVSLMSNCEKVLTMNV